MLTIDKVSKTYAKSQFKAVDDLSLEVRSGEIFGFLGPNGAGKSTTIKMITGIIAPNEGSITINGYDVKRNPIEAKKCIGYVPDNHQTYEKLTGNEYLDFMGAMYEVPKDELKKRKVKFLEMFNLVDAANDQIKSYSHGMKQKILVIGALLHNPKLWILDEPLTGLDPQSAYELKQLMRYHADQGNTVFFSSHVIDVVEKVCDRIGIINKGKLIAVDTLENLKKDSNVSLEKIFLDITKADEKVDIDSIYGDKI